MSCFKNKFPITFRDLVIVLDIESEQGSVTEQIDSVISDCHEGVIAIQLRRPALESVPRWGLMVSVLALMFVGRPAWSTDGKQASVSPSSEIAPGVVVEKVGHQSESEKAGLQDGDVLLSWSRGDRKGEIQSPFDLADIEIEQAQRGIVTLEGLRSAERKSWTLGSDGWGIQVRPVFSEILLSVYSEGRELANGGKRAQAEERWRALADQEESLAPPWLRPWLLAHIAELEAEGRQWKESDQAYQESVQSAATAGEGVQKQVLRAWAKTFEQRSIWSQAERYYQRAAAKKNSVPDNLGRAVDLDNLARVAHRRGDFRKAEDYYLRSLEIRERLSPGSLAVASSFNNLGDLEDDRGNAASAEDYYRRALAIQKSLASGRLDVVATSLVGLGNVAYGRGDLVKACAYYNQALEIKERFSPSLDVAATLNSLGNVTYRRGELTAAEEYYRRALEIKERLAPGTLSVASTLANLGNVAHDRGDLARAEEYYRQDLEITERLAPDSLDFAGSLMDLGIVAQRRGDLVRAEEYYRQALEIKNRLAPGSLDLAYTLNNLGSVAQDRRDLVRAEEYYRQALEIRERLAPGSLDVAHALNNLGDVAQERDDLAGAEEYYRQALEIKEKVAPGSLDVANTVNNLGTVYWKRGNFAKTEDYCRQALEIREKQAPGSLAVALSLDNLGSVAWRRGDLRKAEKYLQRALALRENLAPVSVDTAAGLNRLGTVVKDLGALDSAEQYYRRALGIWESLAPTSANEAESLAGLASIARQCGQEDTALQLYERSLKALEGQTAQLGGADEVRAGFRSNHMEPYRDYLDLLITQGKLNLALQVLERLRARTLLETLATAHVDVRRGAEAPLLAKEHSLRGEIKAKSDRRLYLLGHQHTDDQINAVEREISDLTTEFQNLEAEIRFSSPIYAALTQPQSLSVKEIQEQLLDPDTLLLEYSLGDERSFVVVVSPHSLEAFRLPRRVEIERQAMRLYELLIAPNLWTQNETGQSGQIRGTEFDGEYRKAASALGRTLLEPVAAQLGHKRLLIVAQGVLQYVPFGALPAPNAPNEGSLLPLIVDHEIVNLPSASVLAVLRRERALRWPPPKEVAIFADPVFDANDKRVKRAAGRTHVGEGLNSPAVLPGESRSADRLTRSAADLGLMREGHLHLARLPFTRREAENIESVVPRHKSKKVLDFEASRAFATGGELSGYRVIHFATHALVDNQHPELSGLVLSLVDQQGAPQDGFMDLQDIYNLNLEADLVVLSACDTAMGKQIDGEGMIGLTRGFMYAGARGVIGTLWKVEDFAAAKFMKAFYKAMEQNRMLPAQALRQAQLALWKEKHWSAPYYWAAFTLQGDWK